MPLSGAGGLQRAAEVRQRERRHAVLQTELQGRSRRTRSSRRGEVREVVALVGGSDSGGCRIRPADEEDLPDQRRHRTSPLVQPHDLGDLLQLVGDAGVGNGVLIDRDRTLKIALMSTPCCVTPLVPAIIVAVMSIVRRKSIDDLRATSVAEPREPVRHENRGERAGSDRQRPLVRGRCRTSGRARDRGQRREVRAGVAGEDRVDDPAAPSRGDLACRPARSAEPGPGPSARRARRAWEPSPLMYSACDRGHDERAHVGDDREPCSG